MKRELHKMPHPEAMRVDMRVLSGLSACLVTLLSQGKHEDLFKGLSLKVDNEDNALLVDHLVKAYEGAEMHRPDTPLRIAALIIEALRNMFKPKYEDSEPLIQCIAEALGKFTGVIPLEEGERYFMDRVEINKNQFDQFKSGPVVKM